MLNVHPNVCIARQSASAFRGEKVGLLAPYDSGRKHRLLGTGKEGRGKVDLHKRGRKAVFFKCYNYLSTKRGGGGGGNIVLEGER